MGNACRRSCHRARTWATFLRNRVRGNWAADFPSVADLLFGSFYAFFVVELALRRIVQVRVTRHPTDAQVAQQFRDATPCGRRPGWLPRDDESKYGPAVARVAAGADTTVLRTAYRAPGENATCGRFLGSVRREGLAHPLVLGEAPLGRVLREYAAYFNTARPHRGRQRRIPDTPEGALPRLGRGDGVWAVPVLGGLHHTARRAA